jgi:hypothetical protein
MEELFHISCTLYVPGQIVNAPELTKYHTRTIAQGHGWVDELLDKYKPDSAPSRKSTLFAFASKWHCTGFWDKKRVCENGGPYLYRVKMIDPHKAPMKIVGCIAEDLYCNEDLAAAYWECDSNWKLLEYLSEQMEIIEVLEYNVSMSGGDMFDLTIQDNNRIKREFS